MLERGILAVEPKREAVQAFHAWLDREHKSKVWQTGCKSWYKSEKGRVFTLFPAPTYVYWRMVCNFDFSQFHVTRA
jgi:hypothetical protein